MLDTPPTFTAVDPGSPDAASLLADYRRELDALLPPPAGSTPASWIASRFGPPRGLIVVGRIAEAAVACAGLREHAPDAAELKHLYVAPPARRRGVARGLLAYLEVRAQELGYRRVVLDTAAPLHEAAALYASSGYRAVAPFNDNPRAAHWFEKELPLTDAALWSAFERRTLPAREWGHLSHVRIAFLHLERFELDEAHLRMRAGIIRLNAAHGLIETPARGYHETLTRAWLAIVASARADDSARGIAIVDSIAFWEAHEAELGAAAPLRFYSREELFSTRARSICVPPDIAPLPATPTGATRQPR